MANEALINRLYQMIDEIARLGGEQERTSIVPGILVADANPSDLPTGYIKIVNPRDGTYVPCLTVNGLVVSDNDLVNVLFTKGTEPIALSQSAGSPSSSIKVSELWDSNFGAVAWQTDATGNLANVDGEELALVDSTPTTRFRIDPGTPTLGSFFTINDELGTPRFLFSGGTSSGSSTFSLFDAAGTNVFYADSDGNVRVRDVADNIRIEINAAAGNLLISDDLVHYGDADTLRSFTDDAIEDQAGGIVLLRLTEAVQDLVEIGDVAGTGDVDVNISAGQVFIRGSDGVMGLGTNAPTVGPSNIFGLHVKSASSHAGIFIDAATGSGANLYMGNNGTALWHFGIPGGNYGITETGVAVRVLVEQSTGNVTIGPNTPSGKLDVRQSSTTAAIPTLYLTQADVSEEMIEFNTTIGVGNAIEAVGAKALTTTHFIKVTLPGGLTRYIPVGTIA